MSQQYPKLKRKSHEPAQKWMNRLQTKAADCAYNEYDGRLTEHFIHGIEDEGIISEIQGKYQH